MKPTCFTALCLLHAFGWSVRAEAQSPALEERRFKYERFSAQAGCLYNSRGGNSSYNDSVKTVFVDSKRRLWVGTVTGVAVYDGIRWSSTSFAIKPSSSERKAFELLALTEAGPDKIAEGPPGVIWLAGSFGIWRYRENHYQEIPSEITSPLGIAVDHDGALWVVEKFSAHKFDGTKWITVLRPFFAKPANPKTPGLSGLAIETNGNIWIGGAARGETNKPFSYEGSTWVGDHEDNKGSEGPPMVPLFQFDGKNWRTFGPHNGLNVTWAVPEIDEQGRKRINTASGYYVRDGEIWRQIQEDDIFVGKHWVLRKIGFAESKLLFRENERLIEVQPIDHQTGKVLNVRSELSRSLRLAEDPDGKCLWLGTRRGLYRIWQEERSR